MAEHEPQQQVDNAALQEIVRNALPQIQNGMPNFIVRNVSDDVQTQLRALVDMKWDDSRFINTVHRVVEASEYAVPDAEEIICFLKHYISDHSILEILHANKAEFLAQNDDMMDICTMVPDLHLRHVTTEFRKKRAQMFKQLYESLTKKLYEQVLLSAHPQFYRLYTDYPQLRDIANKYEDTYRFPYNKKQSSTVSKKEERMKFKAEELPDDAYAILEVWYLENDWQCERTKYAIRMRNAIQKLFNLSEGAGEDDFTSQHGQSPARLDGTKHLTPSKGNRRVVS